MLETMQFLQDVVEKDPMIRIMHNSSPRESFFLTPAFCCATLKGRHVEIRLHVTYLDGDTLDGEPQTDLPFAGYDMVR